VRLSLRRIAKTGSRGQALVELALVAPVMLLLLGGAVDLGRLFYSQVTIADSAREGVMWAVQHPGSWTKRCDPTDTALPNASKPNQVVCHAMHETTNGFVQVKATDVTMTPACNPTPCPVPGGSVTVTVRGTFKLIMGGITFPLAASATGKIQQNPILIPPPPGSQTITFGPLANKVIGTPPITVSASASSGLIVTFTSSTPSICSSSGTNGSTITLLAVGTCTVRADQAGNQQWAPAPFAQRSFDILPPPPPGPQTITFAPLPNQMLGTPPFTVTATASSGLTVTFSTTTPLICTSSGTSGATITLVAVGTCSVLADQAGNAQFTPAPTVQHDFTVTPLVCTAPVASFTVNPTSGNAANNGGQGGTLFTFNSSATTNMTFLACNPTWSWNFGDSTGPSSVANPTHTYSNANKKSTRRVTLVASNLGGQSTTFHDIVLN
jgi:Flp pilus assembly protein TadG